MTTNPSRALPDDLPDLPDDLPDLPDDLADLLDLRIPPDRNGSAAAAAHVRTAITRPVAPPAHDLAQWAARTLAALGLVLSRWGRQDDLALVVHAPADALGRGSPEIDTTPLAERHQIVRLTVSAAARFDDLVHQAARGLAAARGPVTGLSGPAAGGTQVRLTSRAEPDLPDAASHLTFAFSGSTGAGRCGYDGDRHTTTTAERLLDQVGSVYTQGTRDPHLRLDQITLFAAGERERIIGEWSRGRPGAADPGRGVHDLFSDQAAVNPTAPAVVCGGHRISYRELDRLSNALAHRLRMLGVGREDAVGVLLGRGTSLIVAYLGVLKAGAAYVPVDPGQPAPRRAHVMTDCGARVVVTDGAGPAGLPHGVADVIAVGALTPMAEQVPAAARPGDLAYVIYTSGSTGRPKGVQVEHRNLLSSTLARLDFFSPPYTSYLALAGPSFDALGAGIYLTLCTGGKLVLPTDDEVVDPWLLVELMERERVTHFDGVPGQYDGVLEADAARLPDLRCAVVAGEPCLASLAERHARQLPGSLFVNEYGPTEATIWATAFRFDDGGVPDGFVPIGRPISGARAYVLDDRLEPVPAGVPGELYIGGAGVARGYLGNPELTRQRFLPDPFGSPGDRLYRTGDVARWRYDGNLEFLGRMDTQVKIRGFRVEPGEVEAVLQTHPGVREAVVTTALAGVHGRTALTAYLTGCGGIVPSVDELAEFAAGRLPDYMVPSAWMPLDSIPRTSNGKIDRRALPPPTAGRPQTGAGHATSSDPSTTP
jgi:amino acid adenylation domain-containing protein